MQRPSSVTPTKIPSLGVIFRLVSFTGYLRAFARAGRDWRNDSPHDIVRPFSALLRNLSVEVRTKAFVPGIRIVTEADRVAEDRGWRRGAAAITNTETSNREQEMS